MSAVLLVSSVSTGGAQREREFPTRPIWKDGVIHVLGRQDLALHQPMIGPLIVADLLETFRDQLRVADRIAAVLADEWISETDTCGLVIQPGCSLLGDLQRADVDVLDLLAMSAPMIEFGRIGPSSAESIADLQGLLDLGGVEELFHLGVGSQLPLQLTLPLDMDVEAKSAEGLDSVQGLLIGVFDCDSAVGEALRPVLVACRAAMPQT